MLHHQRTLHLSHVAHNINQNQVQEQLNLFVSFYYPPFGLQVCLFVVVVRCVCVCVCFVLFCWMPPLADYFAIHYYEVPKLSKTMAKILTLPGLDKGAPSLPVFCCCFLKTIWTSCTVQWNPTRDYPSFKNHQDLKCWGAWDTTCWHKAKDTTHHWSFGGERHGKRKHSVIFLERMREGHHQFDKHWKKQRQFWGNFWETGLSA